MQTKCILLTHNIQTKCRLAACFACILIANLAHLHQLMVGPKRPAVDKLHAVEVLVPDVEATEDLNLRPLVTASAALGTSTLRIHWQLPLDSGSMPCSLNWWMW